MRKGIAASVVIALAASSTAQAQMTFHWPAPETAPTGDGQRFLSANGNAAHAAHEDADFFIHGTSAELPPGTPVEAYLAEPLKFTWYPQTEPVQTGLRPALPDTAKAATPGFSMLEAVP